MSHTDTPTPLHQQYLALVGEICANEPQAYRWFLQVLDAALLWDHVIDGDPIDQQKAHETMSALVMEWVFNDFFHKHRTTLVPVISGCVSAWKHSKPGSEASYLPYTQLPAVLALLLRGQAGVDAYLPRIHDLIERERFEDRRRDSKLFFIVGLPRTRSAWLSALLTSGDVTCYHEALRRVEKPEQLPGWLGNCPTPIVGDADPTLPLFYPKLKALLPPHRVVFILRDPEEAKQAFAAMLQEQGICGSDHLASWEKVHDAFVAMRKDCPDAMSFKYEDLDDDLCIREIAEYCTGLPVSQERFAQFNELKITAHAGKVLANQKLIP